jgi:hypothetical protein
MPDARNDIKNWNFVVKGKDKYLYAAVDIERSCPLLMREGNKTMVKCLKRKFQSILRSKTNRKMNLLIRL